MKTTPVLAALIPGRSIMFITAECWESVTFSKSAGVIWSIIGCTDELSNGDRVCSKIKDLYSTLFIKLLFHLVIHLPYVQLLGFSLSERIERFYLRTRLRSLGGRPGVGLQIWGYLETSTQIPKSALNFRISSNFLLACRNLFVWTPKTSPICRGFTGL